MALVYTATFTGLQTLTITLPNTDSYTITGTLELPSNISTPTAGAGGGAGTGSGGGTVTTSSVVATIKHSGSTIFTSSAGDKGFLAGTSATAGDNITVALASSAATDQGPNAVKCTVAVFEGEAY